MPKLIFWIFSVYVLLKNNSQINYYFSISICNKNWNISTKNKIIETAFFLILYTIYYCLISSLFSAIKKIIILIMNILLVLVILFLLISRETLILHKL